jgi:hypothetical protein
VPSWQKYQSAKDRQWVRSILSALAKTPYARRAGNYKPERHLTKETLAVLEGDTEEQRKRDRDIIVRYEDAHGVRYERDVLAEKARLRLREVGRSSE